jgi:hypothetical protein
MDRLIIHLLASPSLLLHLFQHLVQAKISIMSDIDSKFFDPWFNLLELLLSLKLQFIFRRNALDFRPLS